MRRPYLFKYYYDALMFWLELTRGGGRLDATETGKPAVTSAS